MKTLFIGGIKSGKSRNAENYIKKLSDAKPVYLTTTELTDDEIQGRGDDFITVEEAINLKEKIALQKGAVLVECLSMWINNMLYHEKNYEEMEAEIATVMELKQDIVFVMNDVGCGIIPEKKLARQFVDISGKLSQLIAQKCDEVYHVVAGISTKIALSDEILTYS